MAQISRPPTPAELDQMVSYVQAVDDPATAGVNPAQLRPFYPGVGWGQIYGVLFSLVDEGRLTRTVQSNGAVSQEYFRAVSQGGE